jgi:imidazolonepropionase-like amidohydrolase
MLNNTVFLLANELAAFLNNRITLRSLFISTLLAVPICHVAAKEFQQPESHATETIVIQHVNVVDVLNARIVPDQSVILRNALIRHVGNSGEAKIPKNAKVVNGTDKYLSPGFADMHVHLYTEGDVLTYVLNGITTVRNMAGDARHLRFRTLINSNNIIGPRIITAGPVVETGVPSHPDNILLTDPRSAYREVARQKNEGYDFIKVYNQMNVEVYKALMAAAFKLNMPVAGHVPFEVGLTTALQEGQISVEHFRGYIEELTSRDSSNMSTGFKSRSVAWNHIDERLIDSVVVKTLKSKTWNCPTFSFTVHELSPINDHKLLLLRPEVKLLSLEGLPDREKNSGYLSDFSESDFAATQSGLEAQFALLRALDKSGGNLLVGTDSWLAGYAFADELELLKRAGLSHSRILKMATFDAAVFLKDERNSGTVEAGKRADLVLLDANPLENIENVRRINAVVIRGRYLSRDTLNELMASLAKKK